MDRCMKMHVEMVKGWAETLAKMRTREGIDAAYATLMDRAHWLREAVKDAARAEKESKTK